MNSREKQRRAMHAKGGALARVRQLPLYMKIINVVLAVVLALGVGSNWAYAAELLPEAGSEAVTVAQDGSQTLTSASVGKANSGETVSYAWQILNQATGDFIEINGEVASTITVDYAMLKNQLDENNTTTVRSVVYDSSEKVIAQKDYYISMDMNMKTIGEAVQANALASFPGGETLYAEGQSNDPINAEYAITINYVDSKGHVLLSNSEKFQEQTAIRWFVQLPGGYTTNNATVKSKQPADVINIAYQEPDLKLDGLYITSANGITGNVEIDAVVASEKFPYDISAEYEKLITGDYDPPVIIPGGENGEGDELGAVIPSDYDKTYLTEVYKGKGWEITYNVPSTVRENKQTVSVKLSRTYSTLYFDLNDGINGPVAVYIKQGVSFNTVKAWKQGTTDVYLPSPTPFKNAYNFDSWNTAKDGSGTKMPTDNWAKDTNPAPGTDTTYYAQWVFSGTDTTPVTVVLAYWGEMADAGGQYEYLEERYDQVPYNEIQNGYTLPINGKDGAYNPQRSGGTYLPKTDRRYPQIRKKDSSGDDLQFDLDDTTTNTLQIPNLNSLAGTTFDYDDLYFYAGDDTHTYNTSTGEFTPKKVEVRADGSTVINIALNRKVFRLQFSRNRYTTQTIFGRWGQKIYGTYTSTGSAVDKVIEDPRYPGDANHYQYGYLYMRNYFSCSRWDIEGDTSSTTAASLFAYMPYDNTAQGWSSHTCSNPYSPGTNPSNYYWGGFNCSYYDNSTSNLLKYYLQTVGAEFMHWGRDSGHSSTLDNRIATLKYTLKAADTQYNGGPKYQKNFGESTATYGTGDGEPNFTIGSSTGSTLVNVFVDYLGFQSLIAPNSSHPELQQRGYDSPLRGSNPKDPGATNDNSQTRSGGWSFYYKRNTFPLYIKNIYGSEPVYDDNGKIVAGHYDYCIEFQAEVQYGTPIDRIVFDQGGSDGFEQGEPTKGGSKVDGLTGIKNGDSLSAQGFVTSTAELKVPASQDEHLVFDGWYEDSGFASKIEFDPTKDTYWKMPNHQQDIYAKWVKPQQNIRYWYTNPTTGQETPALSEVETYDTKIVHQPTDPVSTDTERFVSWYYWTSATHTEENKVYFNPSYMNMPYVEYGSEPDKNGRIEGTDWVDALTLDVHQEWVTETNTEYTFQFMLENTTTKVADDIVGRCDYYVDEQHTGDHPSYDPTKMDPTDFYVEYRGVLASKDTGPWQFDKIVKKESPTDNLHIFYFKYDKEFWYKTVYQYAGTDGQYHQFKAIDWQKSGEDHSGHEIAQTVDAGDAFINNPVGDDGKTYPVHLVSTRTVTKNLLADGEAGHPDDNIFYFNYAMNDDVKFIYKTATFAKAQYGNPELTYNGGSVNPQEQTVAVILPDGQFSSSTATAFNGFKFVGWYPMGADGKIDLSKPAITTDNIINAPKNTDGFYMEGATYFAAFEYDANITINYNVRAAKSIDAAGNPQDEITPAPTGTTLTPASETNTPVGYTFTGTVADPIAGGFYAYRWVDSQGNVVKAAGQTDMNKFVPSAVDSGHGYSYYEQETYTLWIIEKGGDDQATITYKVSTGQTDWGDVALNSTPAAKGDSVIEKLAPYSGVAVGAIASISSQMYKFKGWSNTDGGEIIAGSKEKFVPTKADGELWTDKTYYAVFALNQVTIKFTTDGHGDLTNGADLTATVNDTYTVTSAAAAENPGKFDVFHGGSSIRSVTQKPWYGYKFKEWVLDLGSGQEQALPVDKTITSDLTFKAKYEETSAVLTYVPYPDTIIGKVQETGGAVSDRVQQNVLSVSGAPASVTALPATGYAFDYWTKDSPDGDHITGQTITATQDTEEGTGRKAFNNHTYYAHFKTYDVTVKFIVHEDYPNGELSDVEGEPVDTHQFTVQSNSQFKIEAQTGTYGNVGLFKIWAPGANVETDDPVVIEQISSNNTEQHYLTWLRAKLKAVPDEYDYDYSSLPSPQILNDPSGTEYIFAGVLQQRGQTEYHIRYWQEKVDAAVTDNPLEHHPYTSEYYTQEGDDVIATGTKGQQMVYDPKSYEGFNIQKVIYTPTDKLIPEEGTGYVDIYYDRQEDYEFVFRSRSQTPENAAARVLDPELPKEYETTWESLYDFLSHDEADKVPWSGIYGAKFIAFDTPWGDRNQEIVYVYTDPNSGEVQSTDPLVQEGGYLHEYWKKFHDEYQLGNAHYYTIGERPEGSTEYPGKGICDVYYDRASNYPYFVKYYRENTAQTGWEANSQLMTFNDSVDGQLMEIVKDGVLQEEYNFENSKDPIPNPEEGGPTTWDAYLQGFSYGGCDPVTGSVRTDSWGCGENYIWAHYDSTAKKWIEDPEKIEGVSYKYAVMKIYYVRNTNTPYSIDYYQETASSALDRYNHKKETVKATDYAKVEGDTEELFGVTGQTVPLNTDVNKYTGFTYVATGSTLSEVVSDTQIEIKPDGKAVAKVYFTRNINPADSPSFTVKYFLQNVDGEAAATTYTEQAETKTVKAFADAKIYVSSQAAQDLDGMWDQIKNDDYLTQGYHYADTMSISKTPGGQGYEVVKANNSTVVNIYFDRNTNNKVTVKYMKETLNPVTQDPTGEYVEVVADRVTINGGQTGDPVATVVTGANFDFASYVVENKYRNGTTGEVGFNFDHTNPAYGSIQAQKYYVKVKADGTTTVEIFYNRVKDNIPVTVHYWAKDLDAETWTTPIADDVTDRLSTGQTYAAPIKEIAGYKWDHSDPAIQYAYPYKDNGDPNSYVLNVYYTRLTNVTYKVETYYETVEHAKDHSHSPEWKLVKEFSDVGTTGDTINKEGRFTPTLAGFNTPTTAGDETIKGDGTSVLRVYYTRTVSAAKARVEVYTETWQHAVDPTYSEDYVLAEDPTVYTGFIDEEIDLKAAFNDKYVALGYVWNDDNPDKAVLKVVNSANENTYKIYFDKDVASQGLDIVAHYETVASAVEHKKAVPAFARQFATQDDGQYEFGPVTKHLDKDAVNGLYIGRECSMVPGEGFIDTPDAELDKAGFFFDADFNSSDEAKALTDPATFPTYTIHLETDGEKNVAHVYYLRQTNISFTVHYKLETTKSYADTNDQETAEHKAEHWNDEAVSEDAVKGTNTHFYDDQKLSPYSGQFTYGYSFNLCDKTDWGFDIPGYTLRGFKNSSGDVIGNTITTDPLTEVLAPVDTDLSKNEYYIYYVKNANEEFTVKYNFETYEYASGQETDPDKRFKYDSTKDVKFHSYLGDVVDKDYYDTRTMDVLKQEFPGFTFIDDLMSPKELTLEYGQTEAERTINCYYSRDYYNPPESAGYTATYWANKIVDGVVKTDEFEYLGEKEFDAIFDEPVTVKPREAALLQKSVKGNEKLVEDFGEEYLFDHADYTADTTAESFKVDASHTQSVKVYYKPYLGPNPPSPQEAAFTVTYKGLSIEAAKAGGTHIREQYTEKLAEINFGAWPDAKITIGYQEPLAPKNKVNQTFTGFTYNANLVDINGSPATTPWELDLDTAAKQTGNTITLYYDRDVYDPPEPPNPPTPFGYKINHMVQSLDYLLHGIGEEYVCEQEDYMKAVYGETVQGSYAGNTDMKAKIDAFREANKTESGEYGFTLREDDPISPASLYIDKPDTYEFYVYYDRGLDDKYTFKTQRMVKNPDFIRGTSDVEYLAFEDPQECYPLYKQEVVDATCTERIWTPIEGYTFENRCNPDSITIPQTPGNLLMASASNEDLGTIQGFYDLVEYPQPEYVNGQTGDSLGWIVGALSVTALIGLGLFLAMSRRKIKYVPKH